LAERQRRLTVNERQHLKVALANSLSDSYRSSLPAPLRARTDRLLSNVGEALAADDAYGLAGQALCTRLKVRRVAATKLLRRIAPNNAMIEPLRFAVANYQDIHALELLCRLAGGVTGMDCCSLLRLNSVTPWGDPDTYLGGLVLERMWRDGVLDHGHAINVHPVPYLCALGRTGDVSREREAIALIESTTDLEAMKMGASVFGRLRSTRGVEAVDRRSAALWARGTDF